jgi:hypothetical protein
MEENMIIGAELLERTEKYRIDSEEMVTKFIEQIKENSFKEGYELVSYGSVKKEKKSKGEIIDQYWVTSVRKKYN